MKYLIKNTLRPLYQHIKSVNHREFNRLMDCYGAEPRYKEIKNVKFLDFVFDVPDLPSFVWQFKEIFVDDIYKFQTQSDTPYIIDCGANIGMSCLYYKKLYPNSKILAFEADEYIANVLRQNMKVNHINDVEIIDKAVWIDDKGVAFNIEGADGGCITTEKDNRIIAQIESIRLKEYLNSSQKIDMLKIDIEGAEVAVLEDCKDSLQQVQNLFIEYHAWRDNVQSLSRILQILELNGFRYYLENIAHRAVPFMNKGENLSMDLQINIFAYR